jgi:hypothetical protein
MTLFDLNRFIEAQEKYNSYEKALEEVRNGNKEGHWIWYIFPYMRGLRRSYNPLTPWLAEESELGPTSIKHEPITIISSTSKSIENLSVFLSIP